MTVPGESKMVGWIKIYRSIKGHWIFKNSEYFKAWCIILMNVNHSDKKILIGTTLIECNRGQSIHSLSNWAKEFGESWTVQKVRTFFILLEKDSMINTQGLSKTTRLSVCNYETYQERQQTDNTQPNKQITNRQQTDNNKQEGKEQKNEEEVNKKFSIFWESYPKKVMKGKAEKTFAKVIKTVSLEVLLEGLKNSPQLQREDKQYIPNAQAWLNSKGWEDEKEETYRDLEFNAGGEVYIDRKNCLVYDINGKISKFWEYDSQEKTVLKL